MIRRISAKRHIDCKITGQKVASVPQNQKMKGAKNMKKKLLSALIACTMIFSAIGPMAALQTASADAAPLATYNKTFSSPYAAPSVTPPEGVHPRIMVRDANLTNIRNNWDNGENASAVAEFERLAEASIDTESSVGTLNSSNNFKRDQLRLIEAKAFDYLLNKDSEDSAVKERAKANGSYAVLAMDKFLATANYASEGDVCRESGYAVFVASEVYDWCYDKMIKNDYQYAKNFIYWCENLMSSGNSKFEVGYPPSDGKNINGHAGEYMIFRDMLAFAIAIYDEKPAVYNYVMGRIEQKMAPARKWFYDSAAPYQADAYGAERYLAEVYAETLMRRMTWSEESVFTDDDHQGFKKVARHWLYMHRPDGRLFTRGDDFTIAGGAASYNSGNFFGANFMAGNLFKDGYVKGESFRRTSGSSGNITVNFSASEFTSFRGNTAINWLIMNDPSIPTQKTNRSGLAKSVYFGSPSGEIVAKTSWTYGVHNDTDDYLTNDAAAAYMRIGEYYGGNHDDLDSGSFQLYYKGILASASGNYDEYSSSHSVNYRKRTISHNALTISSSASVEDNDAGEDALKGFFSTYQTSNGWWTTGTAVNPHSNDGGQRIANPAIDDFSTWRNANGKYKRATVIDHYVSDDYSYIKGDLTPAYAQAKLDTSVPVIRNMAFIATGNSDVPAFMVVYDKLKGKSSSNVPQFNLHMQTEPTVSGNTTTVVNGGGKMTVKTLLPASASISKTGGSGNQYKVSGTNYPPTLERTGAELGWGRIEITPTSASGTTEFLNVLAVSDAGYTTDIPATKIEGTNVTGARVLDEVVLFSQSAGRVSQNASFTVSGSDTGLNFKVLGVKPGYWMIAKNGETIAMKQVEEDEDGNGATLSFAGDAGAYTLTYAASEVHWLNVYTEDFEGNNGQKWWACFDDQNGEIWKVSTPSGTNNTGDDLGSHVFRLAQSTKALRYLNVYTENAGTQYPGTDDEVERDNPYLRAGYTEDQLKFVRISLDIMKNVSDRTANVELVGKKNGEIVTQSRTVGFNKDGKIYINGASQEYGRKSMGSYSTGKWYKIVMEIDCLTDTYKVGIGSGSSLTWLDSDGLDLDFDCILGINVRAYKEGTSTTKETYVDNIAFDVLMTGEVTTSSVTLNTNGGTVNSGNVTSYVEGEYVTLPTNVTKDGYVFGGWYENSGFTGSAVTAIPATATGNKTYYAKWLNKYAVTLNTNGGTVNSGNITEYVEGTGATLPTDVTKNGYDFLGWYDNSGFNGSAVTAIPANATGAKTFYANWQIKSYTLSFELNGGATSDALPTQYSAESSVSLPANVTRSGFTFAGWYYDRFFTEGPVTEISNVSGDKTLYARYTKNGRSDAEITDNYIVAASENFDAYTVDDENNYTGSFADGFANIGGTADYTSYICANPYGEGRGNVLGMRHPKSGTSVYWGMSEAPTIPAGARQDLKKIKFSFDTARGFASQSNYQLDLIMDGRDSADNALDGQVLVRISKGRSIHYIDGTETVLTGVTMPQNDWTHIDVYVDTENHLMSLYQDSLPLAENIVLTGDFASFDEITGFRFKSVTTANAPETHAEYLDNVKFAVLASTAKARPVYTDVFDLDFESSNPEYYNTADAGMVANGSAYIDDDPAGLFGQVMRLRHTKSTVSAEMARSGAGSALGSSSKDEFKRVKFGFDHYVAIAEDNSTSSSNNYYTTDIVVYGDTAGETGTYTGIGMFSENATIKLYDGATTKAVATYAREKWQRIEFYVDCLAGTYDAYLDGHIIAEDFALPAGFENIYAIRISAHKLSAATNSYTYIDNISFAKSPAVSEGITLTVDYEQEDEQFMYNVNATGYTKSENAYIIIGIYNPDDALMYLRKEAFDGSLISDEDEIEGLVDGAYIKAFAWDMTTFAPLGAVETASQE